MLSQLPNFLKGLVGQLRYGSPPDITEQETLSFMVRPKSHSPDPHFSHSFAVRTPAVRSSSLVLYNRSSICAPFS